jgi:SH3 domain-containing protein
MENFVARPRPRRAYRPPLLARLLRVGAPLAVLGLATTGVVAFALPGPDAQTAVPAPSSSSPVPLASLTPRAQPVSRDLQRPEPGSSAFSVRASSSTTATVKPEGKPKAKAAEDSKPALKVTGTLYATDDLNIRVDPKQDSRVVEVVDPGTKLKVTRTVRDGFRYVSYDGRGRWVKNAYLSKDKPKPESTGGVTMAACGKGSAMESGLTKDAILVHRTVCARYPQVTSFGGTRGGGGFHATGQAVDCMISDSTVGHQIADWVRSHARELGVSEVIYAQHIWTVQRSGEGWRSMSDRGSATANHYDHVHVSVYGNRATG